MVVWGAGAQAPPTTPAGVAAAPLPDLTTSHCHLFTSTSVEPVLLHMPGQCLQTPCVLLAPRLKGSEKGKGML